MLAQRRRRSPGRHRSLAQLDQGTELTGAPQNRVVDIDDVAVVHGLVMLHPFLRGQEGLCADIDLGGEDAHPFVQGLLAHLGLPYLVHRLHVGGFFDVGDGGESGIVEHVARADADDVVDHQMRHGVGHLDPSAVLGPRHVVLRRGRSSDETAAGAAPSTLHLPREIAPVVGVERLDQARLHQLAPARPATRVKGRQDALDRVHGGSERGAGDGGVDGAVFFYLSVEGPVPAGLRRDDPFVSFQVSVPLQGAEARERAEHQAGIGRAKLRVVQSETLGFIG